MLAVPYTYLPLGALRFAGAVDKHERHDRTIEVGGKTWAHRTIEVQTDALEIYVTQAMEAMGRRSTVVDRAFDLAQALLGRFDFGVGLPDDPDQLLQFQQVANGVAAPPLGHGRRGCLPTRRYRRGA